MAIFARNFIASVLISAAAACAAGAAHAGPADTSAARSDFAGDIAAPHRPFYPDQPATQTDNPMQEPIEPDLFWHDQPSSQPLTAINRRLP